MLIVRIRENLDFGTSREHPTPASVGLDTTVPLTNAPSSLCPFSQHRTTQRCVQFLNILWLGNADQIAGTRDIIRHALVLLLLRYVLRFGTDARRALPFHRSASLLDGVVPWLVLSCPAQYFVFVSLCRAPTAARAVWA